MNGSQRRGWLFKVACCPLATAVRQNLVSSNLIFWDFSYSLLTNLTCFRCGFYVNGCLSLRSLLMIAGAYGYAVVCLTAVLY